MDTHKITITFEIEKSIDRKALREYLRKFIYAHDLASGATLQENVIDIIQFEG